MEPLWVKVDMRLILLRTPELKPLYWIQFNIISQITLFWWGEWSSLLLNVRQNPRYWYKRGDPLFSFSSSWPRYDTKLRLRVRIEFWRFTEWGVTSLLSFVSKGLCKPTNTLIVRILMQIVLTLGSSFPSFSGNLPKVGVTSLKRLVPGSPEIHLYLLCRAKFIARNLRHPKIWECDWIKHFSDESTWASNRD